MLKSKNIFFILLFALSFYMLGCGNNDDFIKAWGGLTYSEYKKDKNAFYFQETRCGEISENKADLILDVKITQVDQAPNPTTFHTDYYVVANVLKVKKGKYDRATFGLDLEKPYKSFSDKNYSFCKFKVGETTELRAVNGKRKGVYFIVVDNRIDEEFRWYNRGCTREEVVESNKEFVKQVVSDHFAWARDTDLLVDPIGGNFLKKSTAYRVCAPSAGSPMQSTAMVVTDKGRAYTFYWSDIDTNRNNFSKLIKNENIKIDSRNIDSFASLIATLIGNQVVVVGSLDDIYKIDTFLNEDDKKMLSAYAGEIKPCRYSQSGEVDFYTWDIVGILKKWNMTIKSNGEIVSYSEKIIADTGNLIGRE